jgi:hypothetical protein
MPLGRYCVELVKVSAMSEQELREFLEAMDRVRAEHAATPEKARQFLKREGLLTEAGDLAEPYKTST